MGTMITALIFALFLPVVQSVCSCGSANFTIAVAFQSRPIPNPKDDASSADCAMNCTYITTYTGSNSEQKSLAANFVNFAPSSDNAECLTFYDGVGTTGLMLFTTCVNGTTTPPTSYSPSITIVLSTTTQPTTPATFLLTVTVVDRPITTTSTTTTTTAPWTGPPFTCNPTAVQMDIVVLIDCSPLVDPTTFGKMRSFVQSSLLSLLDIQPNNPSKTQVTGAYVSPNPVYGSITLPWVDYFSNISAFYQGIQQPPPNGTSIYSTWLGNIRDYAFAKSDHNPLRRENAPALLYIISGSRINDSDFDAANKAATDMKAAGVRIMTVPIGSMSNNINMLATPGLNFPIPDGDALLANGMYDFINNTACNGNNFCGGCGMPPNIVNTTGTSFSLVNAPNKYCNMMTCLWTFNTTAGFNASVTFDWFDIEYERDYVEVIDGNGNGLALFSGYNIAGAKVTAGTPAIVIRFMSNANNVYTGFRGTASAVTANAMVKLFGESLPNP